MSKYNKIVGLILHALSVGAVILHFADILGEPDRKKVGSLNSLTNILTKVY
ncbi:Putative domain HDIG-containing protein (fragment) [Candidatus Desulfosporosinus infrequens]|uniref:Domain HDIG-containing protein n=1 Tax=Candidatus Desulfosporosinus infrequens TaxID=2043169 RepID=A0A2U3KPV6_9FIRM